MTPVRGEVWLLDLGMAEKVRPALVLTVAFGDRDRALITVVSHTTTLRGSQYEIAVPTPFLKPGAFLVQNVATCPTVRAVRKLGVLGSKWTWSLREFFGGLDTDKESVTFLAIPYSGSDRGAIPALRPSGVCRA